MGNIVRLDLLSGSRNRLGPLDCGVDYGTLTSVHAAIFGTMCAVRACARACEVTPPPPEKPFKINSLYGLI